MKILVTEPLEPAGIDRMKNEGLEVVVKLGLTEDELCEEIPPYSGLVVRSQTRVTARVAKQGKNLRIVGRAGAGYDNIDLEAATRFGIIVANAPGGNSVSAAEHTIALMLSSSRQIVPADTSLRQQKWERKKFVGTEIRRKLIGIVGLGRVGLAIARRLKAFEATIRAYDPYVSQDRAEEFGVQLLELDELLRVSDFITLHLPLTDETRGLIGKERLQMMKPSVRLINCARGGLVDEDALYDALKEGRIAAAAFDVFQSEPPQDHKLFSLPNFIGTPHIAAHTAEAQKEVSVIVAKQIIDALKTGIASNALNIPPISDELLAQVRPFIMLGEKLGAYQSHFIDGALESIRISYHGEIHALDLRIVTASILKKLLEPVVGDSVNYVNALAIARERGIRFTEAKHPEVADYTNLITVETTSAGKVREVAGTLFQKNKPRIVKVDGYHLEAIPEGILLVVMSQDVPGVIGSLGTILGNHTINIAEFRLGRAAIGGTAVSILNLDDDVSPEALADLRGLAGVDQAQVVRLPTARDAEAASA